MNRIKDFSYNRAFERNIGLVSQEEQDKIHQTRVAIAGLGGVGGGHLQTLARMGIGAFNLADPDHFEVVNFNRQLGASLSTVGQGKADVLTQTAHLINPEADVRTFTDGITQSNIGEFLKDVDVVVDGIEFFSIDARRMLYKACRERKIPVVNAGPIGYGAAVIVFMPDGLSFDDHFNIDDNMTKTEQLVAMALGLTPGLLSDLDPSKVNFETQKGPALASACFLCSAAAATEVLKIVCGRGKLAEAPRGIYFDPYRSRSVRLRRPPSVTKSLYGRVLKWFSFRRFPSARRLHESECGKTEEPTGTGAKPALQTAGTSS